MKKFVTRFFFTLFILQVSPTIFAEGKDLSYFLTQAHQKDLAHHPYWKKLLHYNKTLFSGEKSDIDGQVFFLSKTGKKDLNSELDHTLTEFFLPVSPSTETEHAQCRFPARFTWLNENLNLKESVPVVNCARFESWKEKLNPESVVLVFASYYLNNPSSMYGHTFLRLGRKGAYQNNPLLDYTINFAANTNTSNGVAFALLGLAGGYPGTFTTQPYYLKIQKYNNMESRDLWEYELNFSTSQTERLIEHTWELGQTSISYYFLNKNCSYQLLPLIDVALETTDLTSQFRFRAIPLDTLLSVLNSKHLVKETHFRPSHLQELKDIRETLTEPEKKVITKIVDHFDPAQLSLINNFPDSRQALLCESAQIYLRNRVGFKRPQPTNVQEFEHALLLKRSGYPAGNNREGKMRSESQIEKPESAHGTLSVLLGGGRTRDRHFAELSVRSAIHDKLNAPSGFIPYSTLEMFGVNLRFEDKFHKLYLDKFTLMKIESFSPIEPWLNKPSWKVHFGLQTAPDLNRNPQDTIHFNIGGGSGAAWKIPYLRNPLIYSMIVTEADAGGVFENHGRIGIGAESGILFTQNNKWRATIEARFLRYGIGQNSNINNISFNESVSLNKNIELRFSGIRVNHSREGKASLIALF